MQPIYKPKGKALEYCDLAINIYTGCNHGCTYCFAARSARRFNRDFTHVAPKDGIVDAVKAQLAKGTITGKRIHLCFTCDPYPADIDTTVTRRIISAIHDSGNFVQILTKGGDRAQRDLDLLGPNDWFGVTFAPDPLGPHAEPLAAPLIERLDSLRAAKSLGITTWVSCEPVMHPDAVYYLIRDGDYIDHFAIGMLNYYPSDVNWALFGAECLSRGRLHGRDIKLKDGLLAEVKKGGI